MYQRMKSQVPLLCTTYYIYPKPDFIGSIKRFHTNSKLITLSDDIMKSVIFQSDMKVYSAKKN